ncbi:polysaccharide biosynthesis protein [Sporolactobacillus terrae]|uniref:Cell division protein n=1 Tax=Sporolactobacillus terrae TaxID=269673 RepID=A0A410DAE4_9BACL|nr:polysaccharide biosynthesis protein [Sporolactobacillus terrae]QAA23060.1 polysaccharide biosynthesis protein [Sporolactobacillus terrae]QAA26032.1 polysaccharide biosynthesis protein [Sporolactobacillus terrae]UAK15125.1 polysaccharide biosynthesis protein [Sporolactobacillus terrae]BBN99469.1 cell division protein [Sporolactobacillus terrae]
MSASKMIRGAMILTVASIVSRLLGIFFIIPYNALTGTEGTFLYGIAYTPYGIMLSVSTMGLPLAVSKFVSKYNALGDYESGRRLLKSGFVLMAVTGLIGFLVLFIGAPHIAAAYGLPANRMNDVILVIRVVSIAILIVPVMSLMRGYFQGYQSMGPTAVSQIVEQVVRIAFILIGAFLVIKVFHGSPVTAAALATFAAFVGAVGGLYVMLHFWVTRRGRMSKMKQTVQRRKKISYLSMYRELVNYAIPFVAVGISMQLYQLIDQFMAYHYLAYSAQVKELVITDLTVNDQKMVMIPVTLATSLAVSAVPAIINSYAKRDINEVNHKITQAFELVLFLTIPAAVGLSSLGYMIHGLLFEINLHDLLIGGRILQWYALTAIFFALFQVTASILQGINRQRVTLISLCAGVMIKILLNPLFMKVFGMVGPILATDIGYAVCILINLIAIKQATGYKYSAIGQQVIHIVGYTAIMALSIQLIFLLFGGSIPSGRGIAFVVVMVSVAVGVAVYLLLSRWTGLLRRVVGGMRKRRTD